MAATTIAPAREETRAPNTETTVNVGDAERWMSGIGGSVLVLYGLTARSWPGLALAGIGGALMYRGSTGHCHLYQALGINTARKSEGPATSVPAGRGVKVEESTTINRPAQDLYHF